MVPNHARYQLRYTPALIVFYYNVMLLSILIFHIIDNSD